MKILHLISGGDVGGAKTHVLSLLQGLSQTETVQLVCFMEGPFAQEARSLGIPTTVMDSRNLLAVRRALLALVAREKYDFIHCHGSRANMMGALLHGRVPSAILTTVHSDPRLDYLHRPLHRLTYGTINAVALPKLDYRVCVSDAMAETLITRGFDPQKLFSIYNGVDFTPVTPALSRTEYLKSVGLGAGPDTVVFGIAARFNPVKDVATLIRGFSRAVVRCPDIRLLIAGDGEEAQMLRTLAAETCPPGSVVFAGWVRDMDSFYGALDVNTLTSLSETFPYALTEGARLHCATIASRVGGVPALIDHGVSGLLFPAGDDTALAAAMADLALHPDKRLQLAEALYDKASREFSFEATVARQKEIYSAIARRRARRGRDGVLICGAYGRGNAGDDTILEAIVAQMRSIDRDIPIWVLSRTPKATMCRYRVGAVYTFNVPGFRKIMKKTKLYLSGGGSLIQDHTSTRSLRYYLTSIHMAKALGNRVLMYGCGIGPVQHPRNRRSAGKIINRDVDLITLRENRSADELRAMGVTRPPVILAADPALTAAPAAPEKIDSFLLSWGIDQNGKYLLCALRPWKGVTAKLPAFREAMEYAYKTYGLTPVFFAVEPNRDLHLLEQMRQTVSCPSYVLSCPEDSGLTVGIMSRMTAALSMRLHALIFASGQGVPLIGVAYDSKVSAFLEYLGQDLCMDLEDVTAEALCCQIDTAVARRNDPSVQEAAVRRLQTLTEKNVAAARQLLEETP